MTRRALHTLAGSLAATLALAGCRPGGYMFVPRVGTATAAPKPSECNLHVVDRWPYAGYEDVGFVEWDGGSGIPKNMSAFYVEVQGTVCNAGGDVVIGQPNDAGKYVRGIVLRRIPVAAPPGYYPR